MAADLLPCAHCGDMPEPEDVTHDGSPCRVVTIACPSCGATCYGTATMPERAEAIARDRWNRRAPPLAAPAPSAMATGPRASDWTAMAKDAGAVPVAFEVTAADQARIAAFGKGGVHDDRPTPPAAPAAVTSAFRELVATVRGECPSLLNEDSGGSAVLIGLVLDAEAALAAAASAERGE